MADCACPRFATRKGHDAYLVSHTLACLRAQRGDATLDQYYGPCAEPDATIMAIAEDYETDAMHDATEQAAEDAAIEREAV